MFLSSLTSIPTIRVARRIRAIVMSLNIAPSKLNSLSTRARALVLELDTLLAPQENLPIEFYREVQSFEMALIRWAMKQARGRQRVAAKLLGLKPSTLNSIIKRYGLNHYEHQVSDSQSFMDRIAYRNQSG